METLRTEYLLLKSLDNEHDPEERAKLKKRLNDLLQDDINKSRVERKIEDDITSAVILLNNK